MCREKKKDIAIFILAKDLIECEIDTSLTHMVAHF